MKIVFSIPIHEYPEVAMNQAENIKKFVPDAQIIFHICREFYNNFSDLILKNLSFVHINPEHMDTSWGNIIHAHLSNFKFAYENLDFDYFVLQSSNDMYVRKGIENYISKYDAGFNHRIVKENSLWWPANKAVKDIYLKNIMESCELNEIFASQVEGTFYKKDYFKTIYNVISEKYEKSESELNYTREEIYFSTIAVKYEQEKKIGFPVTFSKVHKKDKMHWKIIKVTALLKKLFSFELCQKGIRKVEFILKTKIFNDEFYRLKIRDVKKIQKPDLKFIVKNSFINDGFGKIRLYDGNLFSVKRVKRDMKDKVRKYIGEIK